MKKYIVLLLFSNIYLVSYNQVIRGIVLDEEAKTAIPFAAVYFSGTLVGTTSDQDGYFELDITKFSSRSLTISAIGYFSYTLSDISSDELLRIYMTPKVYELEEVRVNAKSLAKDRKANLRVFREEFLGTTRNARRSEIINETDITFNYGSDHDTLIAIASKPILIHNFALGYNITYYLDKFEYSFGSNTITFTGNILFSEDSVTPLRLSERQRRITYIGSRMHFFRSLWANDLQSNGFQVRCSEDAYLSYEDIVIEDDVNIKYLKGSENLSIYRYSLWSSLKFLKEQVLFEQDGFFDPLGLNWNGNMGNQRIADWLPYEYSFDE